MEENEENQQQKLFPAFPYKPYSIQIDFMKALYQSLQKGGISMLESPTGTGKTLSIICSALQWLVDKKQESLDFLKNGCDLNQNLIVEDHPGSDDDEPDWMRNFSVSKETEPVKDGKIEIKKNVGFRSKKWNKKMKEGCSTVRDIFTCNGVGGDVEKGKVKVLKLKNGVEEVEDGEFLVEDYESGGEDGVKLKKRGGGCARGGFLVDSSSEEDEEEDGLNEEEESRPKIYFCSRTHSQLSQFIKELRKTKFANELKVVSLGSRKNFCINEEVLRLGSTTRINERCLELQKNKSNRASKMMNLDARRRVRRLASSGCPMLRSRKTEQEFRSEISQQGPLDIEDLVKVGHKLGTCPYYGSRSMVTTANLVILPYQSLLSKASRESLGLSLKNNVVIIDEAHNLVDSLISMYDAKITSSQLECIHSHLEKYFERFRNLLGPGNRRYIQTLMVLTRAFLQSIAYQKGANYVDPLCSGGEIQSALDYSIAINEFLFSLNIDNINLVKLLHYIEESNVIHKVCGYGEKLAMSQTDVELEGSSEEGSTLSGFRALVSILSSLTNNDGDGRIIISRTRLTSSGQQGGYLKYVMLTGQKIFSEVVSQSHAIILAGGTLQPIEETKERLFPWLQPDQLHFFSCGHIIPPANILPVVVSQGPSGQSFDLSYSARSSSTMIEELGLLLCNLAAVVPEGIVVFFSSFDYEGKVYEAWKASGILARMTKKKQIFREPRKNTDVELVLKEYKETIDELSSVNVKCDPTKCSGAVLLAIVGGKISEGINFSDGMGRCIVMVGLPYPSPSDIELMERVKYIEGLDSTSVSKTHKFVASNEISNGDIQAGFDILRCCKRRGRQYYENICMKAVNQSIGRAIRHVNDFAAILLVDARYASDPSKKSFSHVCDKLPQWIRDRLVSSPKNYGAVHRLLHQFFKFHRKKESNQ
ncbi:hypothetical protein ACH5RR_008082 [Cinchona calisaya]|uniref:Helicase ATP-binding domain-containing protein n=1 Tax=Cinchona calisaya TaxID=153742 RepID=A0ABD3AE00_9GENT